MQQRTVVYLGNKLTPEEYNALWEAQGGVCASCGHPERAMLKKRARELAVDHCHTTGRIRGLLCGNCNRALGLLYEDPQRIQALLEYTEKRCLNTYDIEAEIAKYYVPDKLTSAKNAHAGDLSKLFNIK